MCADRPGRISKVVWLSEIVTVNESDVENTVAYNIDTWMVVVSCMVRC